MAILSKVVLYRIFRQIQPPSYVYILQLVPCTTDIAQMVMRLADFLKCPSPLTTSSHRLRLVIFWYQDCLHVIGECIWWFPMGIGFLVYAYGKLDREFHIYYVYIATRNNGRDHEYLRDHESLLIKLLGIASNFFLVAGPFRFYQPRS